MAAPWENLAKKKIRVMMKYLGRKSTNKEIDLIVLKQPKEENKASERDIDGVRETGEEGEFE